MLSSCQTNSKASEGVNWQWAPFDSCTSLCTRQPSYNRSVKKEYAKGQDMTQSEETVAVMVGLGKLSFATFPANGDPSQFLPAGTLHITHLAARFIPTHTFGSFAKIIPTILYKQSLRHPQRQGHLHRPADQQRMVRCRYSRIKKQASYSSTQSGKKIVHLPWWVGRYKLLCMYIQYIQNPQNDSRKKANGTIKMKVPPKVGPLPNTSQATGFFSQAQTLGA